MSKEILETNVFAFDIDQESNKVKKESKKDRLKNAMNKWVEDHDENAYKIVFEYYYPKLLNWVKYSFFQQDPDVAEDCVIETFATVYEKTHKYYKPQGYQFQTWIYTVCKNICLDKLKKKNKLGELDMDINDISESMWVKNNKLAELTDTINDNYGEFDFTKVISAQEPMSRDMIWQKVYDVSLGMIDSLDDISRDMIKEKFLEKMKIKDMAEKYGRNESYIKNHIYNSLKKIKSRFLETYPELFETYRESLSEYTTYFEK